MDLLDEITVHVRYCLLPKLARNIDEIDNHPEFYDRHNKLDTHFPALINGVSHLDFKNIDRNKFSSCALPALIILYLQRSCPAVWNTQKCKDFSQKLNNVFRNKSGVKLESVLQGSDICNVQDVFDNILLDLNKNVASEDFKKYPGLIEVYCMLIKDIKEYQIKLNPQKIFPICLLLIDDFKNANKIKGLRCCYSILQCLNEKHFKSGNYYEVLFGSLKKTMAVKDAEVTKSVLQCLLDLIKIMPTEEKKRKLDEAFGCMLEQLHFESNLYRKTVCLSFVKETMLMHKVDCVSKKLLKVVLLENIHLCCNDAVADIMLVDVLECLQVWITHCWCAWKLSSDHKILSALIKLLYVSRKENVATEIQNLIVSLVALCTRDEQKTIYKNLEKCEIKSPDFKEKLEEIKSDILVLCE